MPTYNLNFINFDPWTILDQTPGNNTVWTGPSTADGVAVITDSNTGADGLVLDNVGESATANLTLGATSVTGVTVSALEAWTLENTATGEVFQVITFFVPGGSPGTYFTLSEVPLVNGETYQTLAFSGSSDSSTGPAFSYLDYFANNGGVDGTTGADTIDAGYTDTDGDAVDDGTGNGASGDGDYVGAGAGADSVASGAGDDTVLGGTGDDTIEGGTGDDSLDGGADSDTLYDGLGADTLLGGAGNDLLVSQNAGDAADQAQSLDGGEGDDTIRIEGDFTANDTILGGTGTDELQLLPADNRDLTVDIAAGTVSDGLAGDQSFSGIENITTGGGNDTVTGDANANVISTGDGADNLEGGRGSDTLQGGDGADTIVGDEATPSTRAVLDWEAQATDETDVLAGFTQNTGEIDVAVSFSSDGTNAAEASIEATDTVYVEAGEEYDTTSSLFLFGNGDGETSTTTLDFAAATGAQVENEVENVAFRINDIDYAAGNHQDEVIVNAFDANGDPVAVTFTPAGNDTVASNTITAGLTGENQDDAAGSVLIEIAGPVAQVEIIYSNLLTGTQGIWVSDVYFDSIPLSADTADVIDGGAGADSIDGMFGDDTITGGLGDDTITGGDGDDVFVLEDGFGADVITDFSTGDDDGNGFYNDQLDVTNLTDANGNPVNAWDVVVSDDGFGNALLAFPNSETILLQGVAPAEVTGAQLLNAAGVPCFTSGTLISTPRGDVPIEELQVGDEVITKGNGVQKIRWHGSRALGRREMEAEPKHRPVLIPEGVLGNYAPLLVSPLHGMVVRDAAGSECFARARHLAEAFGPVRVANGKKRVTYHHLLLDAHQVIFANGAAAESFYPGKYALEMYPAREVAKIEAVVPGLAERGTEAAYGPTARPFLKRREVLEGVELRRSAPASLAIAAE